MEYEQIEEIVKNSMSEKRYKHSQGVAKRAEELALIYGQDPKIAKLIGIAHDIAKEMPKEDAIKYAEENGIVFDKIEENEPGLWHSKLGANIAVKKFGFTNEMAQAILYHTTGNVNMSIIDKIIYVADKTDETRTYEQLEEGIKISNQDLEEGVLFCAKRAINYSMQKITLIHPDTIELINQIIMNRRNK